MPTSRERYRARATPGMAELTGGPRYRRNLGLCTVPGLVVAVIGIFIAPLLIVVGLIGALAGPLIYYLVLRSQASSAAKDQVMHQWAQEHGWEYQPAPPLAADVAFCRGQAADGGVRRLRGPDLRRARADLQLHLLHVRDAHAYRDRRPGSHDHGDYTEEVKHRHTVLRLEVGAVAGVDTVQLADRGIGFLNKLAAAFGPSRQVETESVEFNKRFSLMVNDGADQAAVLRIFTPALLVRLINNEFPQTTFQYERGALAYVWEDQYDVEDLEEIEGRVTSVDTADDGASHGRRGAALAFQRRVILVPARPRGAVAHDPSHVGGRIRHLQQLQLGLRQLALGDDTPA